MPDRFDPELLREMHKRRDERRQEQRAREQHNNYLEHVKRNGTENLVRIRRPDKDTDNDTDNDT